MSVCVREYRFSVWSQDEVEREGKERERETGGNKNKG